MCISTFDSYFHEPLDKLREHWRRTNGLYWGDKKKTVNELIEDIQEILDTFKSRKWSMSGFMLTEKVLYLYDLVLTLERSGLIR